MNPEKVKSIKSTIKLFIRGDLNTKLFESWVYAEEDLENFFGRSTYLNIIEMNFKDINLVYDLKIKLTTFLKSKFPLDCYCELISDLDILDMGAPEADSFFNSIDHVKDRGNPYWWLYCSKCNICETAWLIGQEERHNDIFCLKRLSNSEYKNIVEENVWPNDFDKFENLLKIGYDAGKKVRFFDPLSSSLKQTIIDIDNEHPGISFSDLIQILNIDDETGKMLIKDIEKNAKLNINYD